MPHIRETAITIQSLSFTYPNQEALLCAVDFKIYRGDRMGLIGHNGCGKTTLFFLIGGVLTPTMGEIYLYEQRVKPGKFYPELGVLLQNPDDQLFSASVWEEVAFAPQNLGLPPDEVEQRVQRALDLTGTADLVQRPPHHLSGGEKQRVAIAGVLAMQPSILLCDEPTANLDMRARRRLIGFLQQASQTLVIASHDLEFVLEVCDRLVVMEKGRIVAEGIPAELMSDRCLMEQYGFEVPHSLANRGR